MTYKYLGQGSMPPEGMPQTVELEYIPLEAEVYVTLDIPHMASFCPVTGQPDFASMVIEFVAWKTIETKSLKALVQSFMLPDNADFAEEITTLIAYKIYHLLDPTWLTVTTMWAPRGGIGITCRCTLPNEAMDEFPGEDDVLQDS